PGTVKNVVQLGGGFMIVLACPVDVHGMCPGGDVAILPADKQITPATSAALARRLALVSNEDARRKNVLHGSYPLVDFNRLSTIGDCHVRETVASKTLRKDFGLIEVAVDQPDMAGLFRQRAQIVVEIILIRVGRKAVHYHDFRSQL